MNSDNAKVLLKLEAEYFRRFAQNDSVNELKVDGVWTAISNCESNDKNGVIVGAGYDPEKVFEAVQWVRNQNVPASLIAPERIENARLLEKLRAVGVESDRTAIGMYCRIEDAVLSNEGIEAEIFEVQTSGELDVWLDVAGSCGWFSDTDPDTDRELYKHRIKILLRDPSVQFVGARAANTVVGMAAWFILGACSLLTSLAVLPDFRRCGFGKCLTTEWFRKCKRAEIQQLLLAPTAESRNLYSQLGMKTFAIPADSIFYL